MTLEFFSEKPRSHLIIPDRQANPRSRHYLDMAIGNYIIQHKPDVIVNIGDHADMESLSSYDVGKKSFEGRRYNHDVEASISAHMAMWRPVEEYNARQRASKHKPYSPLTVLTIGNHEHRIVRTIENDAKLEGLISLADLQYERWYNHVLPFLEPVIIDGICYVHYAFKKMTTSPIGGKHQARSILDAYMISTTVGHTPEFDYAEAYRGDNQRIQCIVAGACFEHNEDYAGQRNNRYWRGIIHKKNVKNGVYDFERVSIDRLIRDYT